MLTTYLAPTLSNINVWIGPRYGTSSPRLLVLAESTYGEPAPLAEYVPQWIAEEVIDKTYAALCNACTASKSAGYAGATKRAFWDAIAFYNFVPEPLEKSDSEPTEAQLASGVQSLHFVLCALRPSGVFIFGLRHSRLSRPVVQSHGVPYV
jgi:hypothetical protein